MRESDRLAGVRDNGNGVWFSQKHKAFAGNVQFLPAPDGTPLQLRAAAHAAEVVRAVRAMVPQRGHGESGARSSACGSLA
jgi:hypothetical protein